MPLLLPLACPAICAGSSAAPAHVPHLAPPFAPLLPCHLRWLFSRPSSRSASRPSFRSSPALPSALALQPPQLTFRISPLLSLLPALPIYRSATARLLPASRPGRSRSA